MKNRRTRMRRNHRGKETGETEAILERGEEVGAGREGGAGVGAGRGGRGGGAEAGAEGEEIRVRSGAEREREK